MGRLSTGREKEDTTTISETQFPNCIISKLLACPSFTFSKKVREGLRAVEYKWEVRWTEWKCLKISGVRCYSHVPFALLCTLKHCSEKRSMGFPRRLN